MIINVRRLLHIRYFSIACGVAIIIFSYLASESYLWVLIGSILAGWATSFSRIYSRLHIEAAKLGSEYVVLKFERSDDED